MPLTTFLVKKECSLHMPNVLVSWDKICSYHVSTYKLWFVEGFRRWRGSILVPQRNPDLQGSCNL